MEKCRVTNMSVSSIWNIISHHFTSLHPSLQPSPSDQYHIVTFLSSLLSRGPLQGSVWSQGDLKIIFIVQNYKLKACLIVKVSPVLKIIRVANQQHCVSTLQCKKYFEKKYLHKNHISNLSFILCKQLIFWLSYLYWLNV